MGTVVSGGLEGVVATTSRICYIDGEKGLLAYCGFSIHDLATQSNFEEVIYLLWNGRLPSAAELKEFRATLAAERALPETVIGIMRQLPPKSNPMDVLRTVVSALGTLDTRDNSPQSNLQKAFRLTAQTASAVAVWDRIRNSREIIAPKAELSHAANFLYMLTGETPDKISERVFDICLILHADHELNASTFAARVIAGTLTDFYSAMPGAIGALKGPLHGGANTEVMKVLAKLSSAQEAADWVRGALAAKQKIPGFGHRVYRTEDPRATHLRKMSKELCEIRGCPQLYEMSRAIEEAFNAEADKTGKRIRANVDFYSASVYNALGFPIDLSTPIFAVSRISGWSAHVLEQLTNNRIIRPRAEYTGPIPPQPYIPMSER